ncbi:peptide chain release factor N(5)-glutamine methyltransferase [Chitinimonas sp.]|uniref:peptide chain release factor N(5)-glutamine methyltransferase n=1 Tax=Chitinimonas sp. TaxID=1934313 RepID=UPI0035B422B9
MSTIADLLGEARGAGLPMLEARMLLEHVCGHSKTRQMAAPETVLDTAQIAQLRDLLGRRAAGEPLAYLIGYREFFSLRFEVSPAVLIPRPETELLVELALERLPPDRPVRALDMGTGSGIIPVTLKLQRPQLDMVAVDISPDALNIARRNAQRLGADIDLRHSDWYDALAQQSFALIVSNPPYIAAGDRHLAEGDLRYEPQQALSDGADGLQHIRRIIDGAAAHLEAGGWLLFEHGYDQGAASRDLLTAAGFTSVRSWLDLAGIERVSGGQHQALLSADAGATR